ncbi:hypothetical protein BCV70DRAFT_198367 [Testicularia cyperi]|uniref:Zn(2)-C6 fungal-type domain-containing protein n=1 Tax=Testicularia cyperi TaxID=1882483 RepID=A0A317XXL7_9BASI|nr:hypothetical protein BCV70DRAFT_198367 [Testicularia cyperi]
MTREASTDAGAKAAIVGPSSSSTAAGSTSAPSRPANAGRSHSRSGTHEDDDNDSSDSKPATKEEHRIYKAISRVHRACNACRKQKARCEGPEDPPCKRCRQVGVECIFEKPPKETPTATNDTGASNDRIKALESQMLGMQSMLGELVASIKANTRAISSVPPSGSEIPVEPALAPVAPAPPTLASTASLHSVPPTSATPAPVPQEAPTTSARPSRRSGAVPPHHHPSAQGRYFKGQSSMSQPSPPADVLARYQAEPAAPLRRPTHPHASSSYSVISAPPLQPTPAYLLQQQAEHDAPFGHPPLMHDADVDRRREAGYASAQGIGRRQAYQPHPPPHHAGLSRGRSSSRNSHPDSLLQQPQSHSHPQMQPQPPQHAASGSGGARLLSGESPQYGDWSTGSTAARHWPGSDRSAGGGTGFSPSDGIVPSGASDPGSTGTANHRRQSVSARETDISNDQLSAPIEALRGLADAAALAAEEESEAQTSASDSNEEAEHGVSNPADGTGSGEKRKATGTEQHHSGAGAGPDGTPSLQLVDETGNSAKLGVSSLAESGGASPHKKRRRNTELSSPGGDGDASAAGNTASTSTGVAASGKGRMEAPEFGKNAAGDLVTLGMVSETDAKRLFATFQKGVPKFISIFHLEDEPMTTDEAYSHVRSTSYFLFNVMIAIGAKVECGGRSPNRLYQTCMAQAKRNAKDTLFSSVAGKEAVQAMVLLAAYSENGWLPLGLSIRMAQELGLDRSFQKLMSSLPASGYIKHPQPPPPPKHLTFYHNSPQSSSQYTGSPNDAASVTGGVGGASEPLDSKGAVTSNSNSNTAGAATSTATADKGNVDELKDLARGARLWFFLFLFDHQASYGAGRPAMLSKHYVRNCRAFLNLQYPLTVKTDARFISSLELLIIRETHYDAMAPYDQPVDGRMLLKMRKVTEELNEWHQYWSTDLEGRGYGPDSFFQQSLMLQCASAELYLSCTALRGIKDANDADQMGPEQKELIIQATRAADTCLSISVNANEYREMLGWAPHYTHVTAAFACVFLIKIARLFPRQVDTYGIFSNAERLATRLAEVPATKYARVIRILLAQAWKKITDLSPAIGLYAALGAEATRPGAITPAEIKTGGPSDSGISLLYKLLQEHQQGQLSADGDNAPGETSQTQTAGNPNAAQAPGTATEANETAGAATGARTPRLSELMSGNKWLMSGLGSPSMPTSMFNISGWGGSGTVSPRKSGGGNGNGNGNGNASSNAPLGGAGHSHRGSIDGQTQDTFAWSSFLSAQTPTAGTGGNAGGDGLQQHSIQLPLWMQESTGAFVDFGAFGGDGSGGQGMGMESAGAGGGRGVGAAEEKSQGMQNWTHQDHYQSPVPHTGTGVGAGGSNSQYTSPAYQTPLPSSSSQQASIPHHQHNHSQGLHPSLHGHPGPLSQHQQQQQQSRQGLTGNSSHGHPNQAVPSHNAHAGMQGGGMLVSTTNFDSVLSDLGLPLDGLDGLFVDLPLNAPTSQSNYSV